MSVFVWEWKKWVSSYFDFYFNQQDLATIMLLYIDVLYIYIDNAVIVFHLCELIFYTMIRLVMHYAHLGSLSFEFKCQI